MNYLDSSNETLRPTALRTPMMLDDKADGRRKWIETWHQLDPALACWVGLQARPFSIQVASKLLRSSQNSRSRASVSHTYFYTQLSHLEIVAAQQSISSLSYDITGASFNLYCSTILGTIPPVLFTQHHYRQTTDKSIEMAKKVACVVISGRTPGLYDTW